VLLVLILVLAILGGFLGSLLKIALGFIVLLALVGALLGYFVYNVLTGSRR
jgi:hypothetical protein